MVRPLVELGTSPSGLGINPSRLGINGEAV
jgi:hypothetical protein